MSVSIKYKGSEIAALAATGTKTLNTAGKYCEGNIIVENTESGGGSTSETWVLNSTLNMTPQNIFQVNFTSNGTKFTSMRKVQVTLLYSNSQGNTIVGSGTVANVTTWENDAYRKLVFDEAPTGDLLTWLTANGVKQPANLAVQPSKDVTVTSNGTTEITPDAPYDALKKVDVTVDVASGGPSGPYIEYTSLDSFGRVFTAKFRGTVVPEYAFAYLAELTSVDMPDNVIAIGDSGFYRCQKLALTSLPSGITSIGEFAFLNCYQLSLTTLPSGITALGQYAFNNCPRLALTSLPSGITSLPTAVFQYCPKLALTALPSGLTSIGAYAFKQGTGLASITLPPALTTIGDFAFANCTGLETVKFTSTVSSIPNGVFSGCTKLSTIYVPWSQGQVANAPWGASNATIIYDYTEN